MAIDEAPILGIKTVFNPVNTRHTCLYGFFVGGVYGYIALRHAKRTGRTYL